MKLWGMLGALNLFLAVALGAFGAHGLKGKIADDLLAVYETGVRYQMIHGLGLLALAALLRVAPEAAGGLSAAGGFLLAGIGLFSGSLYLLALTGVRALGAVTPFGGVAFLIGWALLFAALWRLR
ncbi:DUF423 domain-containing protein [Hydrogenibacillus schlegelii]|uniref:DUF423 domain-containing protein n=1 Tax=Hydrogenibacillus schlegelii TaxID=1484 RepID=A0A179IQX3_HYDSH|nr:DUF423 domain-containing protein [Hydrogenibacillus schlegelii]MBT9283607.1 DUF423 domain-containing protein [Hydrogenibacillus schlegelii]OAR05087.1 hypothetical protein SA87_06170 [Hydrogenibacillus schlegelii]